MIQLSTLGDIVVLLSLDYRVVVSSSLFNRKSVEGPEELKSYSRVSLIVYKSCRLVDLFVLK